MEMGLVDQLLAWTNGDLDEDGVIEIFQKLIDSGLAWQLEGHVGRSAYDLIMAGSARYPAWIAKPWPTVRPGHRKSAMAKQTITRFACCRVRAGWGYAVEVYRAGSHEPVANYTAGDAWGDSQVYGTGQVGHAQLRKWAYYSARMLMDDRDLRGPVRYDCHVWVPDRDQEDQSALRLGGLGNMMPALHRGDIVTMSWQPELCHGLGEPCIYAGS